MSCRTSQFANPRSIHCTTWEEGLSGPRSLASRVKGRGSMSPNQSTSASWPSKTKRERKDLSNNSTSAGWPWKIKSKLSSYLIRRETAPRNTKPKPRSLLATTKWESLILGIASASRRKPRNSLVTAIYLNLVSSHPCRDLGRTWCKRRATKTAGAGSKKCKRKVSNTFPMCLILAVRGPKCSKWVISTGQLWANTLRSPQWSRTASTPGSSTKTRTRPRN